MEVLNVILFLAGFIRTLVVIVLVYYGLKLLAKYVMPLFVGQSNQQQNFQNRQQSRREGDVTVEGNGSRDSKYSRDEGEYVDFEEVE